jgi:superfamily II DNA or RNA helicase/ferric iron reductase protein FhuF
MLSLLPHQQCCLDAVLRSYEDKERIISFQMATGSGKTRVLLSLPSSMKYKRIIYVFPTLGLIRQFKDDYLNEFTHIFPKYVEASSDSSLTDDELKEELSRKTYCVITTYLSLPKVLQFANDVDCTLFDEGHHYNAPECHKSMTEHKEKIKTVIRASATLNESDTPCFTYPFHQAVKDGVCRDYSTYCFIKKKGSEHELISYLEEHRKQTGNSKIMVFTTFTESEKEGTTNVRQFVDKYRESVEKLGGWIQGVVSSQSQDDRQKILETFESNDDDKLSLVVSCRTIGEGVDTKKANVVLFVDPIRSTVMIIQRIGRGTRVYRDAKGNPLPVQRDGSVIVGIYIDPATYEGKSEEEIDKLLKENMSETGDFSAIFCVLAALRATDPDTYYQCIHFLDRQKTHARIKEQGMDRIEVPRDGNCFFHCVGLQTGETHTQVRQHVTDYMEEHPEKYEDFLSDEDNVVALREEGEWNNDAMDVVVKAAADMLGQTIRVHRPDGRIDEVGEGKEELDVLLEDNHYTFLTHDDNVYNEKVEEKRVESKSAAPKKKLFIDIDPDFKIMWKVSGDLVNDFTARIDAEIENDGLTSDARWKLKHEQMCDFIKKSNEDPTKRRRPSMESKLESEKVLCSWVANQKTNYDSNGHEHSKYIMKTKAIWELWTNTLFDPEYMYALLDFEGQWKINHEQMRDFIKKSHEDPTQRKCPSQISKTDKILGSWVCTQKKNYNSNGHEHSKYSMKSKEIWEIWTNTLVDPAYRYALLDPEDKWKVKHEQICDFIKKSHEDPTKRTLPLRSKIEEKTLGKWVSHQKTNYDSKGSEHSKDIMKSKEIWEIWTKTLDDPEYQYALLDKDFEGQWKVNHEQMCTFIKSSHEDPTKRTLPSKSKIEKEKILGSWVSHQKTNYDSNGPEESKKGLKTPELWAIWTKVLVDPEYMYALLDSDEKWEIKYKEMCDFIKSSHEDPTKRKCPTAKSKIETEKILSSWVSNQKENYDSNGPEESKKGLKTPELWAIWTKVLVDPEYMYALLDPEDKWKVNHEQMCDFIKSSHEDPTKRRRPTTKIEKEKILGKWVSHQKTNYDSKGSEHSKQSMKSKEVWELWTNTLGDPEYMYALNNKRKPQPPLPQPQQPQQPQQNTCASILKSGPNKGKECGRKNCGVHKKEPQPPQPPQPLKPPQALKPMTFVPQPPQPTNPSSDQPRAPRPQSELSLLHKEYKTLRSDNLATKFRENPHLWNEYHQIAEANELSFPDGEVPYQRVIAFLKTHLATFHPKKQKTIVDMGCGTARVHKAFVDRPNLTFHNLDHVACDERVTVADIAHTGLEDSYADVAILCLAMWGSNKEEYLTEAFRLLDPNGRLIIVEPSKRWMDESGQHKLRDMLERHGFTIVQEEVKTSDKEVHKFSLFVIKK